MNSSVSARRVRIKAGSDTLLICSHITKRLIYTIQHSSVIGRIVDRDGVSADIAGSPLGSDVVDGINDRFSTACTMVKVVICSLQFV